jgi:hypothetical protein
LTSLPDFIKAFIDRENASKDLLDKATQKRDEIAANLQITQRAVEVFFQTLGERSVPPEQLRAKLTDMAYQLVEARQRLASVKLNHPYAKVLVIRLRPN